MHAILALLEVVADDRERVGAEQVLAHELLRGLDVGAEADSQHREAAAAGEEVAALEVSWGLDGSHDLFLVLYFFFERGGGKETENK